MQTVTNVGSARALSEARQKAADTAFQEYVFDQLRVEATDGWDHAGSKSSCTVYFENPVGGDSIKGCFTVIFAGSDNAWVSEAYAALGDRRTGYPGGHILASMTP